MALTDDQRGPRAAWLSRHRKARFGSGAGGLEKLAEALRERGAYRAPDTIKGWEASDERSPIPPEILEHLEELFEESAPRAKRIVTTDELINALTRQSEAMEALTAVIALREGVSPSSLPLAVRTLLDQLLGEQAATRDRAAVDTRQAGGA